MQDELQRSMLCAQGTAFPNVVEVAIDVEPEVCLQHVILESASPSAVGVSVQMPSYILPVTNRGGECTYK